MSELPLAYPLQTLEHLRRVDLTLDDVEDRDEAVLLHAFLPGTHHHVLRLQQAPHDVEHRRLAHGGRLLIGDQRSVAGHKVVEAAGGRDCNEEG